MPHEPPRSPDGDLRSDPDVPDGIRYDPDLAVHEPMAVPATSVRPSRRHAALFLVPLGLLALSLLVYLLFGLIADEGKSAADYLEAIDPGRPGSWQAAYELSRRIPEEAAARNDDRLAAGIIALAGRSEGGDPRLRRYLILALGELGDRRGRDVLLDAVHDSDPPTRLYAVWGLGAIGDPEAAAVLLPLLDEDDPGLRKMAAYALGSLPAPGVAEALARLLNDPVDDVAWNAALGLARLGDPAGLPLIGRLLDRGYLDRITVADEAGRVRPLPEDRKEELLINALRSLAALGDASRIEDVRQLSEDDPSLRVRQQAFETLHRLEEAPRY